MTLQEQIRSNRLRSTIVIFGFALLLGVVGGLIGVIFNLSLGIVALVGAGLYAIFAILTLTFLGLGVQPPSADWALDISSNYPVVPAGYWWEVVFDAVAIASLVVAVSLISDSVQAVFER